jgi:hypothetical protein
MTFFLSLCLIVCLCACGVNPDDERLLQERDLAATQIVHIIATATVQAARIQTTLDYAATSVSLLATQSQFLQATVVGQGIPESAIAELRQRIVQEVSLPPTPTLEGETAAPLAITPFARATPTPAPLMPASAPLDPNAPRLENVVTALGVGNDDCAVNVTDSFSRSTSAIYVVAVAVNIPANTRLASRWMRDGTARATFDFTPDFSIQRACIWFFADPNDFAFETGAWTIALEINGVTAATATFTIVDG